MGKFLVVLLDWGLLNIALILKITYEAMINSFFSYNLLRMSFNYIPHSSPAGVVENYLDAMIVSKQASKQAISKVTDYKPYRQNYDAWIVVYLIKLKHTARSMEERWSRCDGYVTRTRFKDQRGSSATKNCLKPTHYWFIRDAGANLPHQSWELTDDLQSSYEFYLQVLSRPCLGSYQVTNGWLISWETQLSIWRWCDKYFMNFYFYFYLFYFIKFFHTFLSVSKWRFLCNFHADQILAILFFYPKYTSPLLVYSSMSDIYYISVIPKVKIIWVKQMSWGWKLSSEPPLCTSLNLCFNLGLIYT